MTHIPFTHTLLTNIVGSQQGHLYGAADCVLDVLIYALLCVDMSLLCVNRSLLCVNTSLLRRISSTHASFSFDSQSFFKCCLFLSKVYGAANCVCDVLGYALSFVDMSLLCVDRSLLCVNMSLLRRISSTYASLSFDIHSFFKCCLSLSEVCGAADCVLDVLRYALLCFDMSLLCVDRSLLCVNTSLLRRISSTYASLSFDTYSFYNCKNSMCQRNSQKRRLNTHKRDVSTHTERQTTPTTVKRVFVKGVVCLSARCKVLPTACVMCSDMLFCVLICLFCVWTGLFCLLIHLFCALIRLSARCMVLPTTCLTRRICAVCCGQYVCLCR